MLTVKQPEPFL